MSSALQPVFSNCLLMDGYAKYNTIVMGRIAVMHQHFSVEKGVYWEFFLQPIVKFWILRRFAICLFAI